MTDIIGEENYDLGHLFHYGQNSNKAKSGSNLATAKSSDSKIPDDDNSVFKPSTHVMRREDSDLGVMTTATELRHKQEIEHEAEVVEAADPLPLHPEETCDERMFEEGPVLRGLAHVPQGLGLRPGMSHIWILQVSFLCLKLLEDLSVKKGRGEEMIVEG